jgi:hypothetical protein
MKALGQQTFIIRTDSKVIQEHIEKESEARNPVLMKKSREMTTMGQTNWRKQQPEIKSYLLMCFSKSSGSQPSKIGEQKSWPI